MDRTFLQSHSNAKNRVEVTRCSLAQRCTDALRPFMTLYGSWSCRDKMYQWDKMSQYGGKLTFNYLYRMSQWGKCHKMGTCGHFITLKFQSRTGCHNVMKNGRFETSGPNVAATLDDEHPQVSLIFMRQNDHISYNSRLDIMSHAREKRVDVMLRVWQHIHHEPRVDKKYRDVSDKYRHVRADRSLLGRFVLVSHDRFMGRRTVEVSIGKRRYERTCTCHRLPAPTNYLSPYDERMTEDAASSWLSPTSIGLCTVAEVKPAMAAWLSRTA